MPVLNPPTFIPHSFQYDLDFDGKRKASYDAGFLAGVTWIYNWFPGGPDIRDDQYVYLAYHAGFLDGINAKIEADPLFGDWFNKNRGAAGIPMSYKS